MIGIYRLARRGVWLGLLMGLAACGVSNPPASSSSGGSAAQPTTQVTSGFITLTGTPAACGVTPKGRDVDIVNQPDGQKVGTLPANQWISVSQRSESGWYQVSSADANVAAGWLPQRGVNLVQPCACGLYCARFETASPALTITDCTVSFMADQFMRIYFLPDENSSVFGVSTAGDDSAGLAQAKTEDGWIGFNPGIAQGDAQGMELLRWIIDNEAVLLIGEQCKDLPVYTVTRTE